MVGHDENIFIDTLHYTLPIANANTRTPNTAILSRLEFISPTVSRSGHLTDDDEDEDVVRMKML